MSKRRVQIGVSVTEHDHALLKEEGEDNVSEAVRHLMGNWDEDTMARELAPFMWTKRAQVRLDMDMAAKLDRVAHLMEGTTGVRVTAGKVLGALVAMYTRKR